MSLKLLAQLEQSYNHINKLKSDRIIRALESAEGDQTIVDMSFTGEVIDEFTTKGYITMAFPTLFPYGTADLRQLRPRKVCECQYFQYLMKYKDGRFARDSRFSILDVETIA
ncbi:hypothetical protein C5167_013388 [Papaver somniferum]|uniref:Helitron helicase-like domain-containing protein n=1 Tax=Papaver somniferum TaxID=3469 RepID=A0A4Y7J472_PAPSO|nr:hypothetical protein C5167_013388 [Papaver somniferum]